MYGKKLGWRATTPVVHCHDIVYIIIHVHVCIWTSDNGYTILYTQCYVMLTYVNPNLCTCMCTHVHVYKRSVSVYNTCMIHIIQPYIHVYTCTCVT